MAATDRRSRRKSTDPRRWILVLLVLLCLGVFCFAGYKVLDILLEYDEGQDAYDELSQYVMLPGSSAQGFLPKHTADPAAPSATAGPSGDTSGLTDWSAMDQGGEQGWAVVNFDALLEINADVVGWIYFPDMEINYPVLQGPSNDTYLYRMVNGKSNGAGSIFMDYRNVSTMTDPHTILYGHHMNDGSMFADLSKYKKPEFYEEHPIFQYITPQAHYEVEIISAYVASTDQDAWELYFDSEPDKKAWVERTQRRSRFKTDYSYTQGDHFMTLSTCSYEFDDARFVVVGVIREIEVD